MGQAPKAPRGRSPLPTRLRLPATGVALVVLAALAWAGTIAWAVSRDMSAMPGTMGLGLSEFIAMWALMMTAMMLPSVWPFVAVYERTIRDHRPARLGALAGGYLLAWALVGLAAYGVAWMFGELAADRPGLARAAGVAAFAALGIYQLTPLKFRCLSHCRSPLAHLLHYTSFKGPLRDLRAGVEHGLYCLGCCWALMLVLIAFGVMNVPAMIGVALIIAIEKVWRFGEGFARFVGVSALVYAALVGVKPSLAPGLDPNMVMVDGPMMEHMEMDDDVVDAPVPTTAHGGMIMEPSMEPSMEP
jgi:predicted metal-binding membrane protein